MAVSHRSSFLIGVGAVVALAASTLVAHPAASFAAPVSLTFGTPQALSASGESTFEYQVSSDGSTTIWREDTSSGASVVRGATRATGPTGFNSAATVGTDDDGVGGPQLTGDGKSAVWLDNGSPSNIYQGTRTGPSTWTSPTTLFSNELTPVISSDGSTLATLTDSADVRVQLRKRSGAGWGSPTLLTTAGDSQSVFLSTDGNVVTWLRDVGGEMRVEAARFAAGSWSAASAVTTAGSASSLSVAGNGSTIAWARGVSSIQRVETSKFNGTSWGLPTPVSDTTLNADAPSISASADKIIYAQQRSDSGYDVAYKALVGNTWGPAKVISNDLFVQSPSLSGDGTTAAWVGQTMTGYELHTNYFNGVAWAGQKSHTAAGVNLVAYPQISYDGTTVVWGQTKDSVQATYAMRGTRSSPSTQKMRISSLTPTVGAVTVGWVKAPTATQTQYRSRPIRPSGTGGWSAWRTASADKVRLGLPKGISGRWVQVRQRVNGVYETPATTVYSVSTSKIRGRTAGPVTRGDIGFNCPTVAVRSIGYTATGRATVNIAKRRASCGTSQFQSTTPQRLRKGARAVTTPVLRTATTSRLSFVTGNRLTRVLLYVTR